jgi:hypothetical protein
LAILTDNYGMATDASWSHGDFNQDGRVSLADLLILKQHFNEGASPSAAAVPEPSSVSLAIIAGAFVAIRRRRLRHRSQA